MCMIKNIMKCLMQLKYVFIYLFKEMLSCSWPHRPVTLNSKLHCMTMEDMWQQPHRKHGRPVCETSPFDMWGGISLHRAEKFNGTVFKHCVGPQSNHKLGAPDHGLLTDVFFRHLSLHLMKREKRIPWPVHIGS